MDTNDTTQTQEQPILNFERPIRDRIISQLDALANDVQLGRKPYASEVFKFEAAPIAKARIVLGMCMGAELGGDKDRKRFLKIIFDTDGTKDLGHVLISALWHWVKPFLEQREVKGEMRACWFANEDQGKVMRQLIREDMDGTWTTSEGQPSQAAW